MIPRFRFKTPAAVLALALTGLTPALGQDAPASRLPAEPIPYTTIRPPKPKPAPHPPARAPADAQPSATATATAQQADEPAPVAAFEPQDAETPIAPAELEAFVDGMVRQAMADNHIGGVTISIVQNGQVALKKGYGFSTLSPARPVDPDRTLFRIGSISKTFTWTLVMNEIEAGRMRLDGPVNLYLPQRVQIPDQGFDKAITLRDLMTHTAGFEDRALGQLFERDYDRVRPLLTYLRQERPRRVREPGTLPAYSNYGAALAGAAAANVAGLPFETLVERKIINPLGLTHTTFREPHAPAKGLPGAMSPALARDLADPLRWTPLGYRERRFEYIGHIAPAGSASTTGGDMARYMLALLNGGKLDEATVFSPKVAGWMRTNLYRPGEEVGGWDYGFQEIALPGGRRGFGHAGATLSFHSNMVLVPQLGLGVFISTNTDTGYELASGLAGAVVQRFYGPRHRLPPAGLANIAQGRRIYDGDYLTTRRAYGGLEGFITSLVGLTTVRVTPAGYLSTTDQAGARLWAPAGKPGLFRRIDGPEMLSFTIKDGKAIRFQSSAAAAAFERRGALGGVELLALLAALTAIASAATLIGLAMRDRRDFRETNLQSRASLLQTTQSVLWLLAIGGFGIWAARAGDVAEVVYRWPGIWLVLASACALVAAVLTLLTMLMLPVVWRGGRRLDSWAAGRKIRFSMTTFIFAAFAIDLAYWGALFPWSA